MSVWGSIGAFLVLPFFLSGCVTTSTPGRDELPVIRRLETMACKVGEQRIYRLTILRDGNLLGVFDLESSPGPSGRSVAVLRGEAMEELFATEFDASQRSIKPLDLRLGSHIIRGWSEKIQVDGHDLPLGAGELFCLVGGMIPATWLDRGDLLWDRHDRRIVLPGRTRTIGLAPASGSGLDARIKWSTGWFSTSSIHVIISEIPGSGSLQGRLEGPYGILIKWIEV